MATDRPKRKRIRLDRSAYQTTGTLWFCTFNTPSNQPFLAEPDITTLVRDTLELRAQSSGINLLLYSIMPDHVHVLASVVDGDLVAFLGGVKSIVSVSRIKEGDYRKLWQRSFHDSGVRKPEEIREIVRYVLENPVKEGLVSEWQDWPWSGGTLIDRTG